VITKGLELQDFPLQNSTIEFRLAVVRKRSCVMPFCLRCFLGVSLPIHLKDIEQLDTVVLVVSLDSMKIEKGTNKCFKETSLFKHTQLFGLGRT